MSSSRDDLPIQVIRTRALACHNSILQTGTFNSSGIDAADVGSIRVPLRTGPLGLELLAALSEMASPLAFVVDVSPLLRPVACE